MNSEDTLRPAFLATAASGGTLLAILSFTGALWPYSPNETALAHLAFANAVAFVGFLAISMIWCAGLLLGRTAAAGRIAAIVNVAAVLMFFICMFVASYQITDSMIAWFDETPRMPAWLIRLTQIVMLTGLVPLVLALFWRVLGPLIARLTGRKR